MRDELVAVWEPVHQMQQFVHNAVESGVADKDLQLSRFAIELAKKHPPVDTESWFAMWHLLRAHADTGLHGTGGFGAVLASMCCHEALSATREPVPAVRRGWLRRRGGIIQVSTRNWP